jgi:hypothetical protein
MYSSSTTDLLIAVMQIRTATFQDEDSTELHIAYSIFKECIFVIMLPVEVSDYILKSVVDDLFRYLSFVFGSIGTSQHMRPTYNS